MAGKAERAAQAAAKDAGGLESEPSVAEETVSLSGIVTVFTVFFVVGSRL